MTEGMAREVAKRHAMGAKEIVHTPLFRESFKETYPKAV